MFNFSKSVLKNKLIYILDGVRVSTFSEFLFLGELFLKVHVKSKLNVCSEFVTPQKNVLLTTHPNLNAKKPTK